MWVRDRASHSRNWVLAGLREALEVDDQRAVACTPWSNGSYGTMFTKVIRTLKLVLSEES